MSVPPRWLNCPRKSQIIAGLFHTTWTTTAINIRETFVVAFFVLYSKRMDWTHGRLL